MTASVAWACWEPAHGTYSVTVTRTLDSGTGAGEMVAIALLHGSGRPHRATLDDALAVLGYTRVRACRRRRAIHEHA